MAPQQGGGTDPLKGVLEEYLAIPGMMAAILVSDQGLMISSATAPGVDAPSIAALVIETVATAQRFGSQVDAGFLDTMSIDFEKLTVVLAPFTPDVMLALVATPGCLDSKREVPIVRDGVRRE
jgi:predicted regulator of Ras-like GTPase activity (Roadblock/LC7/MglB family)